MFGILSYLSAFSCHVHLFSTLSKTNRVEWIFNIRREPITRSVINTIFHNKKNIHTLFLLFFKYADNVCVHTRLSPFSHRQTQGNHKYGGGTTESRRGRGTGSNRKRAPHPLVQPAIKEIRYPEKCLKKEGLCTAFAGDNDTSAQQLINNIEREEAFEVR